MACATMNTNLKKKGLVSTLNIGTKKTAFQEESVELHSRIPTSVVLASACATLSFSSAPSFWQNYCNKF